MKRLFLLLIFLCGAPFAAQAFHIGPATPAADHGAVNFGVGYFFYQGDWNGFEVEQNRGYLHLGYGIGMEGEPRWELYLRGGAADLEASDENFDAGFEPFGIAGIKGAFWDGPRFGWGMALQGGVFGTFDDNGAEMKNTAEVEAGFPVQVRAGDLLFYAGPLFYHLEADEVEEEDAVGGFGGVAFPLGSMRLEFEGQVKSDFSAGGFLTFPF